MEWTGSICWIHNPVQSKRIWIGLDQKFANSADSGLDWIQKCTMCIPYLETWGSFSLSYSDGWSSTLKSSAIYIVVCVYMLILQGIGRYLLCCVRTGLDWIQIMGHQLDWTGLGSVAHGFGLDWIVSIQSIPYSDDYLFGGGRHSPVSSHHRWRGHTWQQGPTTRHAWSLSSAQSDSRGLPYRRWTSRTPTNRSPAGLSLESVLAMVYPVPRPMSLVPNLSSSHRRVTLAVCGVVPSCWNHSRSAPGEPLCSATQKRFRMSTYRSLFTVCVCPSASLKKKGPMMPVELIAHHTVTLGLSGGASRTMSGALEAHTRQFCVFTSPVRWKCVFHWTRRAEDQ